MTSRWPNKTGETPAKSDPGVTATDMPGGSSNPDASIETESLTNIMGVPAFPRYMRAASLEEDQQGPGCANFARAALAERRGSDHPLRKTGCPSKR